MRKEATKGVFLNEPLFKEQIKAGGPVTVTHPKITRYFMTISEAVSLVIQASGMSKGGEVFVLDMGEPVKIAELAKKMIELSGFEVAKDENDFGIGIQYTGLRPGEKLYEELLIDSNAEKTDHPRIQKVYEKHLSLGEFEKRLDQVKNRLEANDLGRLVSVLSQTIEGFKHSENIIDTLT